MSAQLKLVHSSPAPKRELPIRGEIHRTSQNWRDRNHQDDPEGANHRQVHLRGMK